MSNNAGHPIGKVGPITLLGIGGPTGNGSEARDPVVGVALVNHGPAPDIDPLMRAISLLSNCLATLSSTTESSAAQLVASLIELGPDQLPTTSFSSHF